MSIVILNKHSRHFIIPGCTAHTYGNNFIERRFTAKKFVRQFFREHNCVTERQCFSRIAFFEIIIEHIEQRRVGNPAVSFIKKIVAIAEKTLCQIRRIKYTYSIFHFRNLVFHGHRNRR